MLDTYGGEGVPQQTDSKSRREPGECSPNQGKKTKPSVRVEDIEEIDEEMEKLESCEEDELGSEMSEDLAISDGELNVSSASDETDLQFKVLSPADIVSNMSDCIKAANSIIQLPCTTMRVLLNHCGWDQHYLFEAYYAGDAERQKLFQAAGVMNPQTCVLRDNGVSSSANNNEEECGVCFEDKPSSDMFALRCGHRFCTGCWSQHLKTQIMEQGVSQTISCVATNCNVFFDDEIVIKIITDAKVRVKYQQLITNSFVHCNRLMKWCPLPSCVYAIKVFDTLTRTVTCKCGHTFCFKCTEDIHDPIECDMRRKWIKKCNDDSETCNWIAANTKVCPKCKVNIEKNGGCNYMKCRNAACNFSFCWTCLEPWPSELQGHTCKRFDENDGQRQENGESRDALDRYLFFFNRYTNHMNSLKLEKEILGPLVNDKMLEMQKNHMTWAEVQFLKEALEVLYSCRQTLMYTSVFAYFVKKTIGGNNEIEIFQVNQEDLQSATEKLSGFLERNVITTENLVTMKKQVQDIHKYCKRRRLVLQEHVREGYENDWWEFIDY